MSGSLEDRKAYEKLKEERDGLEALLCCVLNAIGGAEEITHQQLWWATGQKVNIYELKDQGVVRVEVADR